MSINFADGTVLEERFEIVAMLSSTYMGVVYKALDKDLNREVVLKLLNHDMLDDEESVARFYREAKSLCAIKHKNVVTCYSGGMVAKRWPYFVLEYLEGKNLQQLMNERKLPWPLALAITAQLARACDCLHKNGIIHRDLKPGNAILLEPFDKHNPAVKLIDFGLVGFQQSPGGENQRLTQTGHWLGTPYYMSPEQCRSDIVDARADVYSLGCVLYELLTGSKPFDADTALGIMHLQVTEQAKDLAEQMGEPVAAVLQTIVDTAMNKDVNLRFQNMDEFGAEIDAVLACDPAKLATISVRSKRQERLLPLLVLAAVAVALGTVAVLAVNAGLFASKENLTADLVRRKIAESRSLGHTVPSLSKIADNPNFENLPVELRVEVLSALAEHRIIHGEFGEAGIAATKALEIILDNKVKVTTDPDGPTISNCSIAGQVLMRINTSDTPPTGKDWRIAEYWKIVGMRKLHDFIHLHEIGFDVMQVRELQMNTYVIGRRMPVFYVDVPAFLAVSEGSHGAFLTLGLADRLKKVSDAQNVEVAQLPTFWKLAHHWLSYIAGTRKMSKAEAAELIEEALALPPAKEGSLPREVQTELAYSSLNYAVKIAAVFDFESKLDECLKKQTALSHSLNSGIVDAGVIGAVQAAYAQRRPKTARKLFDFALSPHVRAATGSRMSVALSYMQVARANKDAASIEYARQQCRARFAPAEVNTIEKHFEQTSN